MRLKTTSLIVLPLLLLFAVESRADRIDQYVRAQMEQRHVPGVAIAVVRAGRVVKARGYGLASVEHNVAVTPETVFEIGSVSKQLTAAAIMLLVEEGKVELDAPVGRYVPEAPPAWSGVTVRHLLTHTSGLRNYTGLTGFELTERLTRAEFVRRISQHPSNFAPGASWSYGNTNYNLLGFIIEAASGRPYWQFMRERIFRPLGMNSTADRDPKYVIRHRASGYEWQQGALTGRDYDLTDVFSAGAIVSTVLDLARWDAALYDERLLRRASLEQIWTPVSLTDGSTRPYGFGWYVENFRGARRVRHNGQTAGFAASIARYTDERLTLIVLTNLGDLGLGGEIALGLAKLYLPSISLRRLPTRTDLVDSRTTQRLEQVLRARLAGRLDAREWTADARAALSTDGERRWQRLASFGALTSFAPVSAETTNGRRVLRYKAALGAARFLLVRFALAEEGIAEMAVEEEE
ncbi:MAG TPA: serine hydrolase domain-containing protein [Pyrinomonadaceae bacterium]|nr:serine hydrolase domain-containing protein [Pyrinomonadaceae bacterium]